MDIYIQSMIPRHLIDTKRKSNFTFCLFFLCLLLRLAIFVFVDFWKWNLMDYIHSRTMFYFCFYFVEYKLVILLERYREKLVIWEEADAFTVCNGIDRKKMELFHLDNVCNRKQIRSPIRFQQINKRLRKQKRLRFVFEKEKKKNGNRQE